MEAFVIFPLTCMNQDQMPLHLGFILPRIGNEHKMNNEYTALIKQDGEWWIGWIEEVPGVNCQEATREELIESLKVTLREALELNREDALFAAGDRYSEEKGNPRQR